METDFLNFRDEEHFGTGLYQNDLLDDSQSSILDIVGDDYSRHDSGEYIDHSVIWEQDVERELNGDVAVIPMSGEINSFPKLSNSPPSKDFQKIFSDWQHFTAIETTPTEDLTADLHLPTQTLVGDMLDCFTPTPIPPPVPPFSPEPLLTTTFVPELPIITSIAIPTETIIPNFDFSTTTIPSTNPAKTFDLKAEPAEPEPQIKIEKPLRKVGGGKNLELLKQVVKEEIDLDTSFKTEVTSSDELDSANDNFDITSYVNGDDFLLAQTSTFDESFEEADESESVKPISSVIKSEAQQYNRKYGGCYEKHMPMDNEDEDDSDEKDDKHEDSEEDCIDVETVSEQMPVLQARDLTSLLEQFEASEAVNPKLPQTLFDETTEDASKIKTEPPTCQLAEKNIKIETQSSQLSEKNTKVEPQLDKKLKTDPQCNQLSDKKHSTSINSKHKLKNGKSMVKNLSDELPMELIQKMKASGTKKQISVIPAMPARKHRANRNSDNSNKIKPVKTQQTGTESIHMDHDYCSMSPSRFPRYNSSDTDTSLKKFNSPDRKCDKIENSTKKSKDFDASDNKKYLGALIDDTAIRIGKQIKNAIINENAKKQKMILTKPDLLKHQPKIKNADGKIMISLLKTNNRIANKFNCNTIVNTTNANDEQIKNIIVNDDDKRNAKKRKLNLEEYKKLRGDIIKTNSCESSRTSSPLNSGANSPMPVQNDKEKVVEEKYQDLIMKMASNILKTNAKSKHVPNDTTLENFIPPDQKPIKIEPKCEPLEIQKTPPKLPSEQFEIKTIVSIGVNTDEITIKPVIPEPKISFKLKKKELVKSKCFEKPSEPEQNSPKIESNAKTSKLNEMITPILQNASSKINSNSLITNITATLLQQTPKLSSKSEQMIKIDAKTDSLALKVEVGEPLEHGEDKTVIILNKNSEKPQTKSIAVQTDPIIIEEFTKEKVVRQYRSRRDSSASSTGSISSLKSKNATNIVRKSTTHRQNHRTSSTNSISSSLGSRWSRSRSRSSSQSDYSQSSYSSDSSRSKSRSVSPSRRWHTNRNSRSRHRYNRSRRRSRSTSYRGNYRRSRSPYSRSRSRLRRESVEHDRERERMREVEERRVIYVGKISSDTTKADLRRRFQNFGPITNVSCHFRDHGDNYGFVTFAYKVDAYEAVERGNDDPNVTKYDISFGGRRAFCKTRYSDLDNIEAEAMSTSPIFRREENSFDILLREVQAKLRKRKV